VTDDPSAALAEIRAREQNTVPGPWVVRETSTLWELILGNDRHQRALVRIPKAEVWPGTANGEFIAHARTDVPRLLAALEAVLSLAADAEPVERDYGGEPIWWSLTPEEIREAIARGLGGKGDGDGN
jgi:hypothetical protein